MEACAPGAQSQSMTNTVLHPPEPIRRPHDSNVSSQEVNGPGRVCHGYGRTRIPPQLGSLAALPLTLTTTRLTPASITLLTLLIRRRTLSQPLRNKLRITRIYIQLNRILARTGCPRAKIRFPHPVALLVQHPIRSIHPQVAPRPRPTTRNNLRGTKMIHMSSHLIIDIRGLPNTADHHPRHMMLHQPYAHHISVDSLTAYLFQPARKTSFDLTEHLLSGHLIPHLDNPPHIDKTPHQFLLTNGRLCVAPSFSTHFTTNFVGTLSTGFTSPSLVTEPAFAGGPSYSILMSMLR